MMTDWRDELDRAMRHGEAMPAPTPEERKRILPATAAGIGGALQQLVSPLP